VGEDARVWFAVAEDTPESSLPKLMDAKAAPASADIAALSAGLV
jgi:hypothetical protein